MTRATLVLSPTRRSRTALDLKLLSTQMLRGRNTTSSCLYYRANAPRECFRSLCDYLPTSDKLSSLPSPRACTCPGEDHPGPTNNRGRGAPEIDILEVEHNKIGSGQVVSQSAQFAPFTHDYLYGNASADQWTVYDPSITRPNTYK
jgi:hypothetical protein